MNFIFSDTFCWIKFSLLVLDLNYLFRFIIPRLGRRNVPQANIYRVSLSPRSKMPSWSLKFDLFIWWCLSLQNLLFCFFLLFFKKLFIDCNNLVKYWTNLLWIGVLPFIKIIFVCFVDFLLFNLIDKFDLGTLIFLYFFSHNKFTRIL